MGRQKKKTAALLISFSFVGVALVFGPAQSAIAVETKSPANSAYLFADDSNVLAKPTEGFSSRELFFKTMLSVLLVVVLGAVAIYISKKFLPRISSLSGKEIRIIETVHLGPRKAVHLLKIGEQKLLIGSSNESITKLADVTDVLTESAEQERVIGNINGR